MGDKMMLIVDVGPPHEQLVKCYDTSERNSNIIFSSYFSVDSPRRTSFVSQTTTLSTALTSCSTPCALSQMWRQLWTQLNAQDGINALFRVFCVYFIPCRGRSVHRVIKVAVTYAKALKEGRVLIVQSGGSGYETVRCCFNSDCFLTCTGLDSCLAH